MKIFLFVVAYSQLLIASPKKVGIYLAGDAVINVNKISYIEEKSALIFLNKLGTAKQGKLDFMWDKRGAYLLIIEEEKITGYECRPWMSGDSLSLLPVKLKFVNKNIAKFSSYEINEGFKVPQLDRKLLMSLFKDLKKLEKKKRP